MPKETKPTITDRLPTTQVSELKKSGIKHVIDYYKHAEDSTFRRFNQAAALLPDYHPSLVVLQDQYNFFMSERVKWESLFDQLL